MKEVNDLLKRLEELEDAPLIWINKKVYDIAQEIKRLKEEYMILQNASDKVEEEKDKEIERLTAESTKWESKFYDEAKKVDKAIEFIKENENNISSIKDLENNKTYNSALLSVKDILQGVDKE